MKRFALPLLGIILLYPVLGFAYVECVTNVDRIEPSVETGKVYFHFTDGTLLTGAADAPGLDRNFSVAMSALMTDRRVMLKIDDGQSCGTDVKYQWGYIVVLSD